MTKLGWRKLYICPKVTKMGSIMGHRIDYNGVGALRASGTYPAKIYPRAMRQFILSSKRLRRICFVGTFEGNESSRLGVLGL